MYTINTPSSALVYSYNQYSTTKIVNYVFIYSLINSCIDITTCKFALASNDTSTLVLDSSKLTFNYYFEYYLQSVNVGTEATNSIVVSCNVVNVGNVLST